MSKSFGQNKMLHNYNIIIEEAFVPSFLTISLELPPGASGSSRLRWEIVKNTGTKWKACFHVCQFPWFVAVRDTYDCCSAARSALPELKYHRGTILQCVPSWCDGPALPVDGGIAQTPRFRKDFGWSCCVGTAGISTYLVFIVEFVSV